MLYATEISRCYNFVSPKFKGQVYNKNVRISVKENSISINRKTHGYIYEKVRTKTDHWDLGLVKSKQRST